MAGVGILFNSEEYVRKHICDRVLPYLNAMI